MKQRLIQKNTHTQTINKTYLQSLNILGMNYKELEKTIVDFAENHPLIEIDPAYHTSHVDYESLPLAAYSSFKDDLRFQLHTSQFAHPECAEAIIDALDDNGYFNPKLPLNFSKKELERSLKFIQTLSPHGVGARNLKECLLLQIRYANIKNKKNLIYLLDHLHDLANHHFTKIAEQTGLTILEITDAFNEIKKLNPKPCVNNAQPATALHPDVSLEIIDDEMIITIRDITQYLTIHQFQSDDSETKIYIQNQLKEIDRFMSFIQRRNTTLLQICTVVFQLQKDFFIQKRPLKPMTLANIAAYTNHHLSTISRCIMNKTFEFQNQTYSFHSLFTSHTKSGIGANEIRSKIYDYIHNEDKQNPYTDTQLCEILKQENMVVSRRIITKYRMMMQIPNANNRKKSASY